MQKIGQMGGDSVKAERPGGDLGLYGVLGIGDDHHRRDAMIVMSHVSLGRSK